MIVYYRLLGVVAILRLAVSAHAAVGDHRLPRRATRAWP